MAKTFISDEEMKQLESQGLTKSPTFISDADMARMQMTPDQLSAERFKPSFASQTGGSIVGESSRLVGNIPSSGIGFGKGIIQTFNPLNTLKTIGAAIKSGKEAKTEGVKTIDVFKEIPKTAYETLMPKFVRDLISGNTEEAQRTKVNDPVGQILPWILMTKWITEKAGVGPQFNKMISDIASPIVRPVKFLGNKALEYTKQSLGATTGVGKLPLEEAYKSGQTPGATEFKRGMKGEVSPQEILNTAETAVSKIKTKRGTEYKAQLDEISKTKKLLDTSPIMEEVNAQLKNFRVKIGKDGKLDFSESPLEADSGAMAEMNTLYKQASNWTDNTPAGIDAFKKAVGQLYSPTSRVRSAVQSVKGVIDTLLTENVPGYAKMTKAYQAMSELLNNLKKDFGLGGRVAVSSMVQRLTNALKSDNQFKTDLINELERTGNVELTQQISGTSLSPYIGKGLIGKYIAPTAALGILSGVLPIKAIVMLLVSSPHIIGNLMRALGWTSKTIKGVVDYVNTPEVQRTIMFQPKK
jgi:hypothetical protein